jgi:hypothetical protein
MTSVFFRIELGHDFVQISDISQNVEKTFVGDAEVNDVRLEVRTLKVAFFLKARKRVGTDRRSVLQFVRKVDSAKMSFQVLNSGKRFGADFAGKAVTRQGLGEGDRTGFRNRSVKTEMEKIVKLDQIFYFYLTFFLPNIYSFSSLSPGF